MNVRASCFVCGADLAAIPAVLLVEGRQAAQCPACLDRQVRDSDLVFRLRGGLLAGLGRVVITRAAAGALAESGQAAVEILARHAGCDHGDGGESACACRSGAAQNQSKERAVSEYRTGRGRTLRVVTDRWADGTVTTLGLALEV